MISEYINEIINIPLLSDEETKALVLAMYNGDTEARNQLIEHNMRLVLHIAKRFQPFMNLPLEDVINIGSFALMKAVDTYDINKEIKLGTFAFKCISNIYSRHIHLSKMKKRDDRNTVSLNTPIYSNKDGDEITLEDAIEDDGLPVDERVFDKIKSDVLKEVLKKLTKEEQRLLCLRYGIYDGINHTLEEIGKMEGITRERVRQKEERAILKLRHPSITPLIKDFFE